MSIIAVVTDDSGGGGGGGTKKNIKNIYICHNVLSVCIWFCVSIE